MTVLYVDKQYVPTVWGIAGCEPLALFLHSHQCTVKNVQIKDNEIEILSSAEGHRIYYWWPQNIITSIDLTIPDNRGIFHDYWTALTEALCKANYKRPEYSVWCVEIDPITSCYSLLDISLDRMKVGRIFMAIDDSLHCE